MKIRRPLSSSSVWLAMLSASAVLLHPSPLRADGGIVGSYLQDLYEPGQRGLLSYDPAQGTEDLILQGEYEGDTDDFGWIVPVPSRPTLSEADPRIFSDCAELTKLVVRDRGEGFGCTSGEGRKYSDASSPPVDVYESRRVGIYRTMILGASDASALADSLTAWGFLHPGNREEVLSALQFYVVKNWFFAAMRTDSASVSRQDSGSSRHGALQPIRLAFASGAPVYPMRISAISALDNTMLLLYVCAPHRMEFPGAKAEYANRLTEGELRSLKNVFPGLGTVIQNPCFLTKLRAYISPSEMVDDIVLRQAPNDQEFREIQLTGIPLPEVLFLPLAWVAVRRFRRRRGRVGS